MQLVLSYSSGDGCTFWCDQVQPFEYVSLEQAQLDFLVAIETAVAADETQFTFLGQEFDVMDFAYRSEGVEHLRKRKSKAPPPPGKLVIQDPPILTLENWFEENKLEKVEA